MSNHVTIRLSRKGKTAIAIIALLFFTCLFAWFTHLYVCFTAGRWGFLIAGALFFPIAIIHGIGVWFGIW